MQKFTFHRQATGFFTEQQNDLVYGQDELLPFIQHTFSIPHFQKQIAFKGKEFGQEKRDILYSSLKAAYQHVEVDDKVAANLEALRKSWTFTITTGHQLSIFTGPVYLIYKIIHVIRLAEKLKEEYPENEFVPVFWMASEDHDADEIRSVEVFNRQLVWETTQKGAVGRFSTDGLEELKAEVLSFFSNSQDTDVASILDTYTGNDLSTATFSLINKLFGKYGLVIVNADNAALKKTFIPVMEKELKENFSFHQVQKTSEKMVREGLKTQVNPREINLFYLEEQSRERILHLEDGFYIEGIGKKRTEELLFELHEHPERFSPNVILRPVYQECILPNLCYVGGVGEISYWLQLKGVFDQAGILYPLIQVRTSILWIDHVISKKIAKADIVLEDLFTDLTGLKKHYLETKAADEIDFEELDARFADLKNALIKRVMDCDPHMDKYAEAEAVRLEKQITAIKEKLVKTVKQRHDGALKALEQIYDRLFPEGGLQERSLNLFTMAHNGKVEDMVEHIYQFTDPLDPDFVIIRE